MSKNATIVELTGKAWARGADGKIRMLNVGDRLLPTDTIILAAGAVMQVAEGTGPDATLVTFASPDAGTPAIVAPGKDQAAPTTNELLRMVQHDLASQGKKAKAGDLEERSGDGHRFVELVRIGEQVEADALTPLTLARIKETIDPLGLEWGHPDAGRDPWPHGSGHDETRARNQTPVLSPDNVTATEDTVVTGNVLGNDSDPENRPLKVTGFEVEGKPYLPGETADIPGKGTITINPDGSYIFVPVPDWHGSVPPITYTVTDGQQDGTTTSTLIIEITPIDDITPDEDSTHSGVPVTVPVLDNDTFENPDAKITGVTDGAHGKVTINPDGTVTYTPVPGYVGDDTFTYTVISGGVTETTTVIIHVQNQPPALVPDTRETPEDTPVSGNVLENDSDPDGDSLTVTTFTMPGLADPIPVGPDGGTATIPGVGTITIHPNGEYTFTPVPDWNGTVPPISYTVSDGNKGGTSTSTLIITVTPVVDITPDEVETHAGDPITIPVLDNDTFEDPARQVTGVTDGSHGTVTFDPVTGEVTYTPRPGYVGEDTFTYTVTSGGVTETTTVTVNVTNEPPVALPDAPSAPEDQPVTGNLITGDDPDADDDNDSDPDGDPLTVTEFTVDGLPGPIPVGEDGGTVTIPDIGTITIHPNGDYTFTPMPDWNGTVPTITYTISDGNDGGTDTSTLIITMTSVNDTPVSVGSLDDRDNEDADSAISVDVTGGFTDIDGDTLTYTATGLPPGLTLDPATGVITGTIDNSASQTNGGIYEVTITATDGDDEQATQTFTWTVTNPAPDAVNDTGTTDENTALTVTAANGVLKNDTDPDGDMLTVSKVGGSAAGVGTVVAGSHGGQFTLNVDGSYTFNPNGQFDDLETGVTRTTSVTYDVSDGEGGTDTATLTITVTGVNDAPVQVGTLPNQTNVDAGTGISVSVTGGFRDADTGDSLTYTATGLPQGLTLDPATGVITGTIDNSASQGGLNNGGVYTVTVTATDEHSAVVTQTFTWTVTNPAPDAVDDTGTTNENTALTVTAGNGVLKNDTDPDGDTLTVSKVGGSAAGVGTVVAGSHGGQFTINPDGQFDDLEAGVTRTTSVTYDVSDGEGGTDTATLTITVTGVNDAPVQVGTLPNQTNVDAGTGISVSVTGGFRDVDTGDSLTYTATGLPQGLTLDPTTGVITGTIDNSASQGGLNNGGVYTVTVTATDEHSAVVTQTFTWTVTNPAPDADPDTGSVAEGAPPLTVSASDGVLKNDTDPDGDTLTVTHVSATSTFPGAGNAGTTITGQYGTLMLNADGSYTYTVNNANPAVNALPVGGQLNDVFYYQISDGEGGTDASTLIITVNGTNDAPIARPDTGTVDEDGAALVVSEANGVIQSGGNAGSLDSDVDGDTLTVTHVSTSGTFTGAGNAGTALVGTYGTLTLNADGSYTYTVDKANPAVNALKDGQTLQDVFHYQISDGHSGTANSTLTITINGNTDGAPGITPVDGNGAADGQATVYESGLTSNGPGGQSKEATGTITISAPDGVTSVTLGATTLTLAQLNALSAGSPVVIDTPQGRLELTGYTSTSSVGGVSTGGTLSYKYVLEATVNNATATESAKTETITLDITDAGGGTSSGNLVITIVEDAPSVGTPVSVTVNEANLTAGNTPNAGALTQGGLLNIRTGADTTDFDTKFDPAQTAPVGLTSGGVQLVYVVSPNGYTLTAMAGTGGPTVFIATLTNPRAANAGYTFQLMQPIDHSAGADRSLSFGFTVTDGDGDTASGNFGVTVRDDRPDAVDQVSISLAEGGVMAGSGIGTGANLLGNDTSGADGGANTVTSITYTNEAGASVTVNVPVGGVTVDTRYGNLTVNPDGTWHYTSDTTENNLDGVSDNFSYTITDRDGSTDTATQPLMITDTQPTPSTTVSLTVAEEALATGSNPGSGHGASANLGITKGQDAIADVKFTTATIEGLTQQNLTSGGVALTYTISADGHTLTAKAGASGPVIFTLTLNNATDASGASQSVTMDLQGPLDHAAGTGTNGKNDLAIGVDYTVSDTDSNAAGSMTVHVTDDVPTAVAGPDVTVAEGTVAATGMVNLIDNDTKGADAVGTNATTVYQIRYTNEGGQQVVGDVAAGANGSTFDTIHGSLTVKQDGTWSYISDSSVTHTQLTNDTAINDVFEYNLKDKDGDVSNWASQTVTVTDTVPTIGTPEGSTVNEANLASGTAPDATGLIKSGSLTVTKAADAIDVTFSADQTELERLELTSGGVPLTYAVTNRGHTLTATAGGVTVFTVTITNPTTANAGYTFTLARPLDHVSSSTINLPFDYTVTDSDSDSASSTVTVTVVDDTPIINQSFTIVEDSTSGVTFNSSADGTSTNVALGTPPGNGVVSIGTDGKLTYVPNANFSGTDTFTYVTTGENGTQVTSTITVVVTPVSDAPTLTVDAASVTTDEDTAVALGLNAPVVTDATDQNGAAAGDNPERLGAITLSGLPVDAVLLYGNGQSFIVPASGSVTIQLSDGSHLTGLSTNLTMTTAQFEALKVLPPAESHANFTVTVDVTSYEVDASGAKLSTIAGATSTTSVGVMVQAVTDPVDLTLVDGNSDTDTDTLTSDHTITEDTSFNLKDLLSVSFPNSDGNTTADDDGSENRWFEVTGFPIGSVVNGTAITSTTQVVTILAPGLSTSATGLPDINVTSPPNYSGDATITVTLKAQDIDADGTGAGATTGTIEQDSVTLNLHILPQAGDVAATGVTTPEDTAVAFLSGVTVTDTDGSEVITKVSFDVPSGWTLTNVPSGTGYTVTSSGSTQTITFDNTLTEAQREAVLDQFTIRPPAHSSADMTIDVKVSTLDTNGSNTSTDTDKVLPVKVTVTAVAEVVGGRSDADAVDDATMAGNHVYETAGQEDTWFDLNSDKALVTNGYDLGAGWSNQDTDEANFARLTVSLNGGGHAGDSAVGSQFKYSLDGGATWQIVAYNGSPVDIPAAGLASLQFMAAPNVSGTFEIGMQLVTKDTDPDTGITVEAVSGSSTLTNLVIEPVADDVMLALTARITGKEDTEIPLSIRPTSSDPSETFNITVSNIPNGAVVMYNGVEQTVTGGKLTITNFNPNVPFTLTPPKNSNASFTLNVSAVSVDGTDTSDPTSLPILVTVKGVADDVFISPPPAKLFFEDQLDSGGVGGQIRVAELVKVVTDMGIGDFDGSEAQTFRISGLPEGFSLSGGSLVNNATGEERVWILTLAQLQNATIKAPANFSGTGSFTVTPVTTENDGDSKTGAAMPVSFTVVASPEATMTSNKSINEDTLTNLGFSIVHHNGDSDETLGKVWIKVSDASTSQYELYLGQDKLTAVGQIEQIGGVDYYVLSGVDIGQLSAKGAANLDGPLGSFAYKYEVIDGHFGTVVSTNVTVVKDGTFTITAAPVTDALDLSISAIGGLLGSTATSDEHTGDNAAPDTVTLLAVDTVTVTLKIAKEDYDGSEKVLRVVIEGVPEGVTVQGAEYAGGGRWILIYDGANAKPINSAGGIELPVVFKVSAAAGGLNNVPITMEVQTQDRGEQGNATTAVVSENVTWHLTTGFTAGSGEDAPSIEQWKYNQTHGTEDAPFTLASKISADITIVETDATNYLTVTLADVPPGTLISGMIQTVVDGNVVWTATIAVAPGEDGDAKLQQLLGSIVVVPPADSNDNNAAGDFILNATLTTSVLGGKSESADFTAPIPVDPVTDKAVISVDATSINEGDGPIHVSVTVSTPADGTHGTIVDGKIYILASSSTGLAGGTLTHNGQPLATEVKDGQTYFVVENVVKGQALDLVYTPPSGQPGQVTFTVVADTQESGSTVTVSASSSDTATVAIVNNGVTVSTLPSSGDEGGKIQLAGLAVALNDADGSEAIKTVLLGNVPNGFLVMVGNDAASATLAANAGGVGGSNTWVISGSDGSVPPYVAIVPPAHWSGTLDDLTVTVESGETSFAEKDIDTVTVAPIVVHPVADGATLSPTNSFGRENTIIALNLNASMKDPTSATVPGGDDAHTETATLKIAGLGAFAAFFTGEDRVHPGHVSYDQATDTYTVTGLSQADLAEFGFLQARGAFNDQDAAAGTQIKVEIATVDGDSTSDWSSPSFVTINSTAQAATTGDDHLLWTGSAINAGTGVDSIEMRAGETLTGAQLNTLLDNVEVLELHGNTIGSLSAADVFGIAGAAGSGTTTLSILGDSGDHLTLGSDWTAGAGQTIGGVQFDIYTAQVGANQVELRVEHTVVTD